MSNYIRTKSLFVVLAAKGILAGCSPDNNGFNTTSTSSSSPACASSCIEGFVAENYPPSICTDNQDLRCLCTRSNPSGLTIGEAVLQCVLASCTGVSSEELGRLYSICSGIEGALPETHATLTATIEATSISTDTSAIPATDSSPPMTSTLPPSIPSPSSTDIGSSIVVASSTFSSPSSDDTTFITSVPSTTSSAQASGIAQTTPDPQTSPSPTAETNSSKQQNLSSGAVAGIAVGGVATALAVFGLLFLFCCIRKRRKSKRGSDRWSYDSDRSKRRPHSALSFFLRPTPTKPSDTVAATSQAPYIPPAGGSKRRSFWRKSIRPEEIGVAVSPELSQGESPAHSVHSHASASALLPDKPNWNSSRPMQPPLPIDASRSRRKESIESTGTVFAEDVEGLGLAQPSSETYPNHPYPPPPRFNLRPLQPRRPPRLVLTQSGRGLPSDPRAQMYAMERQQRATGYAAQPRIPLTPVYDNGNATAPLNAWTSSAPQAGPQLPPGPMRDPRIRLVPSAEKPQHNSSVYDSNASLPPSEPRGHESFNAQPSSAQTSHRTSFLPPFRRSSVPNAVVRSSTASSITSFEDDDDYNYHPAPTAPITAPSMPTVPAKPTIRHIPSNQSRPITLSPVIESPNRNLIQPQPPRFVAYPPIPRPSSIARQAERLPLPRAGRYIDTRGPPPPGPTTSSVTVATEGRVPSSLNVNSPSNSNGREAPFSECNTANTSVSASESARSPSPSETSSALLARRRGARAAGGLKIEEEGLKKKRKEAEGWRVMGTEASPPPQQSKARGQKAGQGQRVDYSGEGWGEEKENQAQDAKERETGRGRWNVTPTRGKDGDLVLRVG